MKRRLKIPNLPYESERNTILACIRQYTPEDKNKVHEINELSLEISFQYYYDLFHEREPELFLIAEHKNEIIGFILVKSGMNFGEKLSALIYAIAVSPKYRSLGVGTQLVNAICIELQRKQIKKFFLHVRVTNKRAIDFYKRLGFKIIKEIKEFYSWGEDAFRMLKIIE